ncbi:unnamed protein product [Sphacelaria rigidula]
MQGTLRSTTGTMFFLAGEPVHFSSSLQRITATSTTEAELIALSKRGKFGTYLLNLLESLDGHPWNMQPYTRILKEHYTFRQTRTTVQAPNTWRLGSSS